MRSPRPRDSRQNPGGCFSGVSTLKCDHDLESTSRNASCTAKAASHVSGHKGCGVRVALQERYLFVFLGPHADTTPQWAHSSTTEVVRFPRGTPISGAPFAHRQSCNFEHMEHFTCRFCHARQIRISRRQNQNHGARSLSDASDAAPLVRLAGGDMFGLRNRRPSRILSGHP
jgi:hypothetical protein